MEQRANSIRPNLSTPLVTGVRKFVVFRETLADTVRRDLLDERPQWPFSCYAPFPKMRSECGSDTSFEELRYHEMKLIKIDRKPIEEVTKQTSELLEQVKQRTQSYYNQVGVNGFRKCDFWVFRNVVRVVRMLEIKCCY